MTTAEQKYLEEAMTYQKESDRKALAYQKELQYLRMHAAQFARNPADALQCFADIQKTVSAWTTDDHDSCIDSCFSVDDKEVASTYALNIKRFYLEAPAEIYWWPSVVAESVTKAACQYPLGDSLEWDKHDRHTVFVFQRPIECLSEEADIVSGYCASAISYVRHDDWLMIYPWIWMGTHSRLTGIIPCGTPSWFTSPSTKAQVQWLYTATRFAESRIIGCSTAAVTRKVRERIVGNVPDINVVHLRSYEPGTRDESPSDRHIDFDFRFWVRGHPRKLSGHDEPIWINTYLKGPDDKPIKERETVFAVTR